MIRLVAKKKLGFRVDGKIITVSPFEFATLPDAVGADPLFKWALADGSIEVAGESKAEQNVQAEHDEAEEKAEHDEGKAKNRKK